LCNVEHIEVPGPNANMRIFRIALTSAAMIVSANAAHAVNPPAEDASGIVLHSTLSSLTGERSGIVAPVADVKPGETFTITGECVARVKSADKLRVVLTLADTFARPGYHALLATDQEIQPDGLEVRVPDVPDEASRVFLVQVFRLGQDMPQICDAGSIRIGGATGGKVG